MKTNYLGPVAIAIALAGGMSVLTSAQTPSNPPPAARATSEQPTTVTGCIQRESDYRKANDAGRGGVAGTGVGAGNEFVLMTTAGTAYELTGSNEGQAEKYIGKRVEISGKVKAAEVSASGRPTGGPTAGAPPAGVDVASKDLQLSEIEVSTVKEATGTCS